MESNERERSNRNTPRASPRQPIADTTTLVSITAFGCITILQLFAHLFRRPDNLRNRLRSRRPVASIHAVKLRFQASLLFIALSADQVPNDITRGGIVPFLLFRTNPGRLIFGYRDVQRYSHVKH